MHSTLGELVQEIASVPDDLIVYTIDGRSWVSADSVIELRRLEEAAARPNNLIYLLEVELVRDVIEAWSLWRDGRTPSVEEAVQAIAYYAENDAYLQSE